MFFFVFRVIRVQGLRVADASVMPTIVNGNTNAACIMIGEKVADLILKEWSKESDLFISPDTPVINPIKEDL